MFCVLKTGLLGNPKPLNLKISQIFFNRTATLFSIFVDENKKYFSDLEKILLDKIPKICYNKVGQSTYRATRAILTSEGTRFINYFMKEDCRWKHQKCLRTNLRLWHDCCCRKYKSILKATRAS